MENVKKRKKARFHPSASLAVVLVVLILYTALFLMPLLWMIVTSFKDWQIYMVATVRGQLGQMIGFNNMTLSNYLTALKYFSIPAGGRDVGIPLMTLYSILYAGGCAIIATMIPCIMAYLVARYDFKFGKVVYGIVLVTMAIPIVGALPSEMKMVESLGLMDSVFGLYVLKANFLGIYFLVFFAVFKRIPKDYTEAAEMDGASELYIMLRIIFPIAVGTITTVLLLKFIEFWNDYQIPMIYWKSRPVLAYGMFYFVSLTTGKDGLASTPVKLSAMVVVAIPIIILFLVFNKKIMSNMSIGGVKG